MCPLEKFLLEAQWQRVSGGDEKFTFAVRSSATAEDLPDASFAGQQETFLNVMGYEAPAFSGDADMKEKVHLVFASLFTDRAISYRHDRGGTAKSFKTVKLGQQVGFEHEKVQLCATCQKMVRSETGSAGVMFSLDTESGFKDVVFVTSAFGLGETVVGGTVNPDEYVFKPTLAEGKESIISRTMGSKLCKMIYKASSHGPRSWTLASRTDVSRVKPAGGGSETVDTSEEEQNSWSASDQEAAELHNEGDIEWARDGDDGKLYIVQARPETVASQKKVGVIEEYKMLEKDLILLQLELEGSHGEAVRPSLKAVRWASALAAARPGWHHLGDVPRKKAGAIITNRGGRTCHAAIIARELGIPAIVGCGDATDKVAKGLMGGDKVTVSCAEGDTGFIYKGELKFESLGRCGLAIMMNVGNPETAFAFGQLPNEGIGLARLEFALLNYDTLDAETKDLVDERMKGYKDPKDGIHQYKSLIGGEQYEPDEENPMIGFRGCGRYTDPFFEECFAMELEAGEAVKMVRGEMGLKNVEIMIPFVRGPQVNMMAELPSNVFLADEFLEYFAAWAQNPQDGFSIGSNDLTQLTLGLDRDSGLVAQYFDERNPAVMKGLETLIKAAKAKGNVMASFDVAVVGAGMGAFHAVEEIVKKSKNTKEWALAAAIFLNKPSEHEKWEIKLMDRGPDASASISYKALILATGSKSPLITPSPGMSLSERISEVKAVGAALSKAKTVIFNGAGLVGVETWQRSPG
eukprot:Skav202233  [mRNA]  locus=scaffold2988:159524:178392:+ [translate_table: standard]